MGDAPTIADKAEPGKPRERVKRVVTSGWLRFDPGEMKIAGSARKR
jgi:hypothetical protein